MKTKLILFCLIVFGTPGFSQSIKLEYILSKIYFPKGSNKVDTLYLNFVIPSSIGFIDTEHTANKYPVKIDYLPNDKTFEKKLLEGKDLNKLAIRIDKLSGDSIVMTIDIVKTNNSLYYGNKDAHFYEFYDKRQIMINYDKEAKIWAYSYLVKEFPGY
jgi:hypothetical protein